jgi:hypothetical protein
MNFEAEEINDNANSETNGKEKNFPGMPLARSTRPAFNTQNEAKKVPLPIVRKKRRKSAAQTTPSDVNVIYE